MLRCRADEVATMRELERLKREIDALDRGRGRRYPSALRERITTYARSRRDAGEGWATISDELSVPWETLRRWSQTRSTAMLPVEVVASSAVTQNVAVVSPSGWRLEGLDVREALAVLRALS